MNSYGHILVPKHEIYVSKIANLGRFGPKPYLKMHKAQLKKNDCLVAIIKGDKRVRNMSCGAAIVNKN